MVATQIRWGEFWFDSWTTQWALYYVEKRVVDEELKVKFFITNEGRWDRDKMRECISKEMIRYVIDYIK